MSLFEDIQNIINSAITASPLNVTGSNSGIPGLVANAIANSNTPNTQAPIPTKTPTTNYVNIPLNSGQDYLNSPVVKPSTSSLSSIGELVAKTPTRNYVNIPLNSGNDYLNSPVVKPPTPVGGLISPTPTQPTTTTPTPQQQIWEVGPGEWYTNEADYLAALARRNAQNNSNSPTSTTGTGVNTGNNGSTGTNSSTGYSGPYDPINDPSYQFRLKQGMDAIQSAAAARGMLNSGRTLKELLRYGQDYASQEYMNEYTRRLNLSQLGLQAAMSQLGGANVPIPNVSSPQTPGASNFNTNPVNTSALSSYGSAISGAANNYAQSGYYTGLGQAGAANAWGNALNGIGNIAGRHFGGGNYSGPAGTNPSSWSNFYSGPAW